jgi:predicted nucleotidyltransferase
MINPSIPYKVFPNTIMAGYMGSISHGTYIPKDDPNSIDDIDVMAVCVGPIDQYLGLGHYLQKSYLEQDIWKENEWDCITYELRKFVHLLLKQNPNVLGLLWTPLFIQDNDVLVRNRDIFVSKMAYHSFAGYAHDQMHNMTLMAYEGYMGEKRKALVDKFGYDTKNSAHLIRLLKTCIEFLDTGNINVDRTSIDAEIIKDIKSGKWSLDNIKKYAEQLFNDAKVSFDKSQLPEKPDYNKANELVKEILMERLCLKNIL